VKLYMGWDSREAEAYKAAVNSLGLFSAIKPEPLCIDRLRRGGLLRRPVDNRGQMYDLPSNAPCSTEFAISRFLVPIICQSGWALFIDCDVVFLSDPKDLMHYADESKAVMVVKHQHEGSGVKMGGMTQTHYHRKNWSSVMLFNCEHPANQRLTLDMVNHWPGRDLHGFSWLADSEIGQLPPEWNWLVNVTPRLANPKIAHFTLGGPWIEGWNPSPHDDLWMRARYG
jgi:lipopolysaccharide biosynthesis glycosyltransferase